MLYSLILGIPNLSDISFAIKQAIRTLFGYLSAIIYDFIVVEYDLFVTLSRAEILDNAFIHKIYEKVGLILGIFMMFKLIFSLIQHLIEPNKFNDKKNGFVSIIQRSVIAIVLLGTVPSLFRIAFDVQNFIVGDNSGNNNVIYKLIIGDSVSTNVRDFGTKMSTDLFFSFYKERDGYSLDGGVSYDQNGIPVFINYDTLIEKIEAGDSFFSAVDYLSLTQNSTYVIDFNWLFSVAVGIFVVWILIMYIIQIGVRVVQLAYLQLIAPVPILSYISDPDGSFNKWIKQCFATYFDLFLRVAILYFIVYLSSTIMNSFGNPGSVLMTSLGPNVSGGMVVWVKIFILIGLLLFGKKAPELIKDLFPNFGVGAGKFSFGLDPKKVLNDTWVANALGGAVGAVGAGASNAVHGFMNMRKAFQNNGGLKSGRAWASAAGAGLKGAFSVAGGVIGGARAGLKTNDITKAGEAIKTANKNRTERELNAQSGYHWYNPLPAMRDGILEFAGEPGIEERIKDRKQAVRDENKRRTDLERGQRIYSTYSKTNTDGSKSLDADKAFRSGEYRRSYAALKAAKKAASAADEALVDAQAELNAARMSGNDDRISKAKDNYKNASSHSKAMQGKLEQAKTQHENNKKIYADDAEIESLYKEYSDTFGDNQSVSVTDGLGDISIDSLSDVSTVSLGGTLTDNSGGTSTDASSGTIPSDSGDTSATNSQQEDLNISSESNASFVSPKQQLDELGEQYIQAMENGDQDLVDELAIKLREKSEQIDNISVQIDDADREMRDSNHSVGRADDSDKW